MQKLKIFIEKFTEAFTIDLLIWMFRGIIAIFIAYFTPELVSKVFLPLQPYRVPAFFFLLAIFMILILKYYQRVNRFQPHFPKFEFNFLWHEYELIHRYIDRTHIIHIRKYKIEALKDGLTSFNERFFWTGGDENYDIECVSKGHTLLLIGKENLFNYYEVKFNRTLKRGDIENIEIRWNLRDPNMLAQPFISTPIKEPTLRLKMKVVFPEFFHIKDIEKEISFPHGRKIPIYFERAEIEDEIFLWDIKAKPKPMLFYHYEIRWILN